MGSKALSSERNDRLRSIVREMIDRDFGGNQGEAARAFGVTPTTVSDFLAGKRGAGQTFITGIEEHAGRSIRALLGERDDEPSGLPIYGSVPGYREAETVSRQQTNLPPSVYVDVRRMRGAEAPPSPMTPDFLSRAALYIWHELPIAKRAQLEREFLEAQMKRIATRAENKALRESPATNDAAPAPKRGKRGGGGKG